MTLEEAFGLLNATPYASEWGSKFGDLFTAEVREL